jgi:DNA-binding PadR family transcriptional regulator
MATRSDVLTLAVLGLLHDAPMHGYELRKQLSGVLGPFRALSYGTLYPALKKLVDAGWISEADPEGDTSRPSRRGRIVYQLTAAGKEHFETLVGDAGPTTWEDESFGVRFAFFSRTAGDVRLRILEGRKSRLEERLDGVSQRMARGRERADQYTLALQQHGLESVQREVRWLAELIDLERQGGPLGQSTSEPTTSEPTTSDPSDHSPT